MPLSMWKQHAFSLATDPLSELTDARLTTVMGGIAVDLIGAPIEPGTYEVRFGAVMGGISLFLPACVTLEPTGRSLWGGTRRRGAQDFWTDMQRTFARTSVDVPSTPPRWAVQPHDERPVTLRVAVDSLMGGVEVHQLEPEAAR